jgi:arylsulfatase A-like enzyme
LDWQRNGKSLREEGYSTDLLAAEAVRWIGPKGPKDPFFLYLPFNAPHGPLQAPERLLAKHAGIADGKRRAYVAMVEALDEAVGKLVAHLEDTGRMKNTLIAFQSDNGGPLNQGANNGSLRDAKGTVYEGGIRVPAFLHWPGKLASRGTKSVTTLCDWLPTLAAAAGIPAKTRQPMDGMNLWPALSGQRELPERENLFFSIMTGKNAPHYALREGRFKLIRLGGKEELYDVESDPAEKNNLLPEREADARPLREKMNAWAALAPADSPTPSTAAPAGFRSPADWASLAQRP